MRSTGASRNASKPPWSWSATNRRLTPSIAANSSVTHRIPAASSPETVFWFSAKWNTTNVVTANSDMPGTDSSVRSSTSSSLRSSAPTVAACPAATRRCTGGGCPVIARGRRTRARSRERLRADGVAGRSPVQLHDLAALDVGRRAQQRHAPVAQARARGRPRRRPPAGSWLEITRVRSRPDCRRRSAARPARSPPGSRFARGSSSSSSSGSCSTALATAARWTIPRESVLQRLVGALRQRHGVEQLARRAPRRRRAGARGSAGSRARSARGRAAARARAARRVRARAQPRRGGSRRARARRRACGRSSVASTLSSVVLPAPFGPNTTSVCPAGSDSETSLRASRSP